MKGLSKVEVFSTVKGLYIKDIVGTAFELRILIQKSNERAMKIIIEKGT